MIPNCLFCPNQEMVMDNLKVRHCPACQTRYHFTTKSTNILTSYHMEVYVNHKHYTAHFYTDHLRTIKEPNPYKDIGFILSHIAPPALTYNIMTLSQRPDWTPFNLKDKLKKLLPFL